MASPRRRASPWALWLAGLVALLAPAAGAQDGAPIVSVELLGDVGLDEALLRANLRTRAGAPLDRALVDGDVRWLADVHRVLAEVEIDPGPVVRFRLSRIRRFDRVLIEGNVRWDAAELLAVARLAEGAEATPDQVTAARDLVRDHYLRAGYAFVQVESGWVTDEHQARQATLRIFEGPHVDTVEVRIEGLSALDPQDALAVMRSPPGFWSWLTGKDFVRADVDADVVLLENFVRGEGYLDGRAALGALDFSEDRTEVRITLVVDEGVRYALRTLTIEGASALSEQALREVSTLQPGAPWRRPDVVRTLRAWRDLYGQIGHIDARIDPRETYDEAEPVVDVAIVIDEGAPKTIRDVIVRGNADTLDQVVRRNLTFAPGDVVDTRELRWSEDVLVALDSFSDFSGRPEVRVATEPAPDPAQVDVLVDVSDQQSGLYSFLVGAGSDSGLFVGGSLDKRNFDITRVPSAWDRVLTEFFGSGEAFHGAGQRLYLEVLPGTETTDIDLLFNDPWLDPADVNPWGLTVNVYDREREFDHYQKGRTGLAVSFDHRLSKHDSVGFGLRIEDTDIDDVDAAAVPTIALASGTTSSRALESSYAWRDLDSLVEPTSGYSGRVRVESEGTLVGGDTDLWRVEATNEWFLPLGEDEDGHMRVLHPRVALGRVDETGSTSTLPFFENFFVGGASGPFAVRGFDFQGVGPHESGDAIGGQLAFAASLEALFPLVTQYNPFRDEDEVLLKGVLFLDVGSLQPGTSISKLFDDLRMGAGGGIRLRLPALGGITLALDLALLRSDESGDETRTLSFEISRRF